MWGIDPLVVLFLGFDNVEVELAVELQRVLIVDLNMSVCV